MAIKTLGRILCLIFEDYNKENVECNIGAKDFLALIPISATKNSNDQVLGILNLNINLK